MMYLVFKEVPGVTVIEQEGQSLPVTLLRRKGSEFLVRAKERGDGRSLIRAFQVVHWLKKKKKSACQFRRHKRCGFDPPRLGRPPGVGNGNPLQYSCLEHSMDRGAW